MIYNFRFPLKLESSLENILRIVEKKKSDQYFRHIESITKLIKNCRISDYLVIILKPVKVAKLVICTSNERNIKIGLDWVLSFCFANELKMVWHSQLTYTSIRIVDITLSKWSFKPRIHIFREIPLVAAITDCFSVRREVIRKNLLLSNI